MRSMCSASAPCSFNCKYCFAKWHDIYPKQPLLNSIKDGDCIILYPCCDGEFFDQRNIIFDVKNLLKTTNQVYVSISTKRDLSLSEFQNVVDLNDWLIKNNKGFVKFSVSVSTKSRICEIEPGTTSYENRLSLVNQFNVAGIHTSLTLKPVLPFIAIQEYFEIINDFSHYINKVNMGGLYVNPSSLFFKQYIENNYSCIKRSVSWIPTHPKWFYIEDADKMFKIKKHASQRNVYVYDSDEELIRSMINGME